MPKTAYVARHVCVEGWRMIGHWGGVPLRAVLEKAGADMRAKYVVFRCDDPISYSSSIDMASALHPQTILCLTYAGRPIEPKFGAPMRLKMTTKLGFKQPKFITSIHVTNQYPGGYWEDLGYNWHGVMGPRFCVASPIVMAGLVPAMSCLPMRKLVGLPTPKKSSALLGRWARKSN